MPHLIARHHDCVWSEIQHRERVLSALYASAGGNCPWHARARQIVEQISRARQWTNLRGVASISFGMDTLKALNLFGGNTETRFPQKRVDEQAAAHSDLAVYAPHRETDTAGLERFAPRENVLVDTVDQCPVK